MFDDNICKKNAIISEEIHEIHAPAHICTKNISLGEKRRVFARDIITSSQTI